MKLVVFSDAHGNKDMVEKILIFNPDADYFISLGDSELQQEFLQENDVVMIKGNSSRDAGFVYERELTVSGVKIFLTHGHKFAVQRGLAKLGKLAINKEYNLVLFGHTHQAIKTTISNIWFVNPGSCSRPRNTLPPSYLVINIIEGELTFTFKESYTNQEIEV